MSKIFFIFVVSLSIFFILPASADNYGIDKTVNATGGLLPKTIAGKNSVPDVIGSVVSIALSLIGIVFFLIILYAGFTWMTAMGNTEKTTKAKEMIEMAAIGLILVLASYAIAKFVFSSLGGDGGKAVGGSSDTLTVDCANQKDGTTCSENGMICVGKSCVVPCEFAYTTAFCISTKTTCQGVTTPGLCPGSGTICCHQPEENATGAGNIVGGEQGPGLSSPILDPYGEAKGCCALNSSDGVNVNCADNVTQNSCVDSSGSEGVWRQDTLCSSMSDICNVSKDSDITGSCSYIESGSPVCVETSKTICAGIGTFVAGGKCP